MKNTHYFKIVLAVIFVGIISFFVLRGCVHKKAVPPHKPAVRKAPKEIEIAPIAANTPIPAAPARMAIILDDWGRNYALVKTAEQLDRPVTLSILPHLVYSKKIAEEAYTAHLGVMLHMPMQPKSKKQPLEPHTILTTSSDETIVSYLDSALASVPHVEGVNNHQGSAATSDMRVMKTVLTRLKEKGLFFVDSEVISTSVCRKVAKEIGIPFARRQVFLDNIATVDAVKKSFTQAEHIALTTGKVVVIGHDKAPTLQAIKEMIPDLEQKGIKLVLVKELTE